MNRIFSLVLSICIAFAGLSTILFGLPSNKVMAEQPATPEDISVVNKLDDDEQIKEYWNINSDSDTYQEHNNNIGIETYQLAPDYTTTTTITSDRPDPSLPGQRIDVTVSVRSSYGQPQGTVKVTTNPGSYTCTIIIFLGSTNHCSLVIPLGGSYVITARYQGNSTYSPSSDTEPHTVHRFILDPTSQSGDGAPGAVIEYEIQLQNKSSQADSYNLSLGAHSWYTTLSDSQIGPVNPGEAASFQVSVTIPFDAKWYVTDSVVITVGSLAFPMDTVTTQVSTRAYIPPQISVDPISLESTQATGQIVTQTLNIRNENGVPLTFEVRIHPLDDLVVYYPFDGNASDYSGNNNDGTVIGAELTTGVCGIPDTAYEFDGLTHYIRTARSPDLDLTANLSISAWIFVYNYPETFYSAIVDKDYNYTGYNLHIGSNGQLHVRVDNSYVEGGYLSANQWHHVVGTYDGSLIKAYIDGVKIGETSELLPTGIAAKDLFIGSWQGERVFDGRIDDVRIYERDLSETEVLLMSTIMCNQSNLGPWLSLNPVFGSVPANDSLTIQVTFNATGLQPDTYTTTLYVLSNDPALPIIEIPVTLTVPAGPLQMSYLPMVVR